MTQEKSSDLNSSIESGSKTLDSELWALFKKKKKVIVGLEVQLSRTVLAQHS